MAEKQDRRRGERRHATETGEIGLGTDTFSCRLIDVSEHGARIRIDGQRPSRHFVGKRITLTQNGEEREGYVVWIRPAVGGAYLGIELDVPDDEKATASKV